MWIVEIFDSPRIWHIMSCRKGHIPAQQLVQSFLFDGQSQAVCPLKALKKFCSVCSANQILVVTQQKKNHCIRHRAVDFHDIRQVSQSPGKSRNCFVAFKLCHVILIRGIGCLSYPGDFFRWSWFPTPQGTQYLVFEKINIINEVNKRKD